MTRTSLASILLLAACTHAKNPSTRSAVPPANITARAPLVQAVDPNLVEMTAEPTTSLLLANAATELGIRVRIVAHELRETQRPPLELALVLDTSGSMEGAPIEALRASARTLAGKLRDGDHLSIVSFNSKAEVLVPNVAVSPANRGSIDRAIAGIRATGTTDLVDGLALGLSQLRAAARSDGISRIVLLSDGVPNSSDALPQTVASIRQAGVSVTSLGFGVDYDTTLMTRIARDTGGEFHYLEKSDEVATVFDAELTKMKSAVARNMQVVIEPGPGVTIAALPGFTIAADGKLYAAIGDLPAGETRDLMIPIRVTARGEGSTAELVEATLHFEDVVGKSGTRERDAFAAVKTSRDAAAVAAATKIDLEVARIRASAAAAVLQAMTLARSGQIQPARRGLVAATAIVKAAAARYKDADLMALVKQLEQVDREIAQIVVTVEPQRLPLPQIPQAQPATAPSAAVEASLRHAEDRASAVMRGN